MKTLNTPKVAQNAPFAHVGASIERWDAKVWCYWFIWPKPDTLGARLGGKRP
jgi:hypothetical protein